LDLLTGLLRSSSKNELSTIVVRTAVRIAARTAALEGRKAENSEN
jgi:hypothetical protein